MNRVIIIGQQGSGKSTLAALLTKALLEHERYTPESVQVADEVGEQYGSNHTHSVTLDRPMTNDGRVELTEIFLINGDAPTPLDNPDVAFGTTDAEKWADGFLTCVLGNPSIPYSKGAMVGYFANAIMRGYDTARNKYDPNVRGQLGDAPNGYTYVGPDGDWHWSIVAPEYHESITQLRAATGFEKELAQMVGAEYLRGRSEGNVEVSLHSVTKMLRYIKAMEKLVQCDMDDNFSSFNSADMNMLDHEEVEIADAMREFDEARQALLDEGIITEEDNILFPDEVLPDPLAEEASVSHSTEATTPEGTASITFRSDIGVKGHYDDAKGKL